MNKKMTISTRSSKFDIDLELYQHLFESSIMSDHPHYLQSIHDERIALSTLIELCRQGKMSYALFFGSAAVVRPAIDKESAQLFGGFEGKYGVGIRGQSLNLNAIRLLIKDVKLKQDAISRFIKTDTHPHVKYLKSSKRPLDDQAECIVDRLGIDMDTYRSFKSKRDALWYLISRLEDNNIFISLENTGTNMPQNLKHAHSLTGVYIRHNKFPYFFVASEGMAAPDNLPARKAFTLIYLTVCLFKGRSKMVSLQQNISEQGDDLFKLTELILMPEELIPHYDEYTIEDLDNISSRLNVSPLAVLTRLRHLDYIQQKQQSMLKLELARRYGAFKTQQKHEQETRQKQFKHNIVNNIRVYQGKAFLRILRDQYIAGKVKRRELNRQLSYGKGTVDIDKVFKGL